MSEYIPIERYRIILRHEILTEDEIISMGPPHVVEYCAPRGHIFREPVIIGEMMDLFKDALLLKLGEDVE